MTPVIKRKNTKILSPMDTIEFLKRLKTQNLPYIASHFDITLRAAQYTRNKYNAYSDESIDQAIEKIEEKIGTPQEFPDRDFEKQEACDHRNATLYLRCECTLVLSEQHIDRVIAILQKQKEILQAKNLIEVTL